ncbi:helix-turn-helix domain-containing protein [uncultured Paludibaculum sp.]|uniref:TetR/AcrR family transcriptional regulator n=1 Tax=uncultured Paludibaculum sp. TaxID=1765020 RepID=UPI002AAAA1A7|nr:helix-turn-helix domain-containing protein [uncultured Paludibaculum sp.]
MHDGRAQRLQGALRRQQVLRTAAVVFAKTGLHGTTTQALAEAMGVSEPVLYLHFRSKEALFREAVERNIETRLRNLDEGLGRIIVRGRSEAIRAMAEETVLDYVREPGHAVLTTWALLEAPEYALDLYRHEVSAVVTMWRRLLDNRPAAEFIPHAVEMCLAHGLWLAVLRLTAESAAPLARQFAGDVVRMAMAHPARLRP